jgi:hypothetical protein
MIVSVFFMGGQIKFDFFLDTVIPSSKKLHGYFLILNNYVLF